MVVWRGIDYYPQNCDNETAQLLVDRNSHPGASANSTIYKIIKGKE